MDTLQTVMSMGSSSQRDHSSVIVSELSVV